MEEFLNSSYFRFIIFPIGSVILGIALKFTTKNDRYSKFKKEDLAVGLELILTAFLMFVVITTDRAVLLLKTNEMVSNILSQNQPDLAILKKLQNNIKSISNQSNLRYTGSRNLNIEIIS